MSSLWIRALVPGLGLLLALGPARGQPAEDPLSSARFFHVALAVTDGEATARWYKQMLGFTVNPTKEYSNFGTRITFMEKNDIRVELIQDNAIQRAAARGDPPAHTRIPGLCQFSMKVASVDKVTELMRTKNVRIAWGPITYEDLGLKFVFIRDREDNLIQFIEMLKKRTQPGELK